MVEKELKLKVAEAVQDDVNKGIVRIDSTYMHQIGIRPGDVVDIEGERKSVSIADRAYPGDIGLNIIRMDGLVRRNSKTGIGELVKVKKADVKEAKKIIIAPARKGVIVRASSQLFKQGLLGRSLIKGDVVALGGATRRRSSLSHSPFEDIFRMIDEDVMGLGFGDIKFIVVDTMPKQAVIVSDMTEVVFNPEATEIVKEKFPEVTYEDIGGLTDEIKKIREMVELPLKHPEIFERLGIEAPKGVLLHGSPGTGKTLLAKAVANETNSHFILINGPEIMSKFYGQSESNLRKKFEDAEKNAPSIIFIDEIDAIATKREEVHGEVERRVVAQLLALMDGLKSRGKVVVIAATNQPNLLDPALRRPGRFDREIEIGVPGKDGRLDILKIHTRNMPLAKNVSLKELAAVTHGFVGADISSLAKEAAMIVLRRVFPDLKPTKEEGEPISKEVLEKLQVTKKDFREALKVVRPSTLREVLVEIPNVKWSDLGGLEDMKQQLKEAVEWPIKKPESFKRLGVSPPKGILLYGAPGTGKTMLAKAVATESEANFILVKGPELLCISADTPIFTSLCGVRAIEDFYKRIESSSEVEKSTKNLEVRRLTQPICSFGLSKEGKLVNTQVKRAHKLWVNDAYKVSLEDGNEIDVSANQPFYVFKDSRLLWIRAEELKIGDYVAKPSKIPFINKEIELDLPTYSFIKLIKENKENYFVKISTTKSVTKLPKKLTKELAEFLGWFVAEGSISKEGVSICNKNKIYRKRIRELFNLFVEKERIKAYEDKIIIYSTPLVKYLEQIFEQKLGEKKSYKIKMPTVITKSSQEIITAFIKGAYDGDGHIDGKKIEYGTMSSALAQGMSYLLTLLGIKHRYWQRKDALYLITISGKQEMQKFKNLVYGQKIKHSMRQHYNARYVIPDVSELLKETKQKLKLHYDNEIPEGLFEGVVNGRKKCGLIRLQRMMRHINNFATSQFKQTATYQTLNKIANGELRWTKVKDKNKTNAQWMYDLETDNSSFIGGKLPLLLHNSKWVGESEKAVREVFKKARQSSPTIIFFDEIDSLAPRRGASSDSHVTERVVNQLLTEMDGLEDLYDVVIIAATNRPDMLDTALLRPGRFDRLILTPIPDEKARLEIFKLHTQGMPLKGVSLETLASKTEGYVGADVEALCREAAILALRKDQNAKVITAKHFEEAMQAVGPSVTKDIENAYAGFTETAKKSRAKELKEEKPSYMG